LWELALRFVLQARRAKAVAGFRFATPLRHKKERHPAEAAGCRVGALLDRLSAIAQE
jgi:hypothetical protein